ncbi:MAG: archaetidylserine decarboxylase [Moritella sp.]|uniref:archaetidylserine decarboxylase n=1 Tax=Moritella sp. TaxID=78556 RepID=UPI0029ADF9A2|nr:archaetidylserine decarboxylase [Moritella sp.]MDX2319193.1 archaetidylserine decarboxylase [Moritella sp.]
MLDKLKVIAQYCFPQHGLSRLIGLFAAGAHGKLTTNVITWFIKRYNVNMDEAKHSDPAHFQTFNDFFTRELKEGVRPINADDNMLCQPVDGAVSQAGPITQGRIVQAKGHDYSVCELLGGDRQLANKFEDGDFATVYLSPRDYHRIHMPITGTLKEMIFAPGDLFSVNPLTAQNVPNLFARNERAIAIFDTEVGPFAMVLVGATIVASIETIWHGTVAPSKNKEIVRWTYENQAPIVIEKGAEMGRFKLGSTIVAVFAKDAIEFVDELQPTAPTMMGEAFARIKAK